MQNETETEVSGGNPGTAPENTEMKSFAAIEIDNRGLVKAKNNAELIRYCKALLTSDMIPKRFSTPAKLFGALMFVRSLGLPDMAIRQVNTIDGTFALFGDLPLALVQKSKELYKFREYWIDADYKEIHPDNENLNAEVFAAVCTGARGRRGKPLTVTFTMKEAEYAGYWPPKLKDGQIDLESAWHKTPKLMLRYKARAPVLKSLFADKINGAAIGEYDFDQTLEMSLRDVGSSKKTNLKNTFTDEGSTEGEQNGISTN